jgi:hypothetical protein
MVIIKFLFFLISSFMAAEKELTKAISLSSSSELAELYYQRAIIMTKTAQWHNAINGNASP